MEVQDRDGVPSYRLAMRHPTIRRTEILRDDGSFSALPWVAPSGAFSVVPNAGDGAELVVYGSPPEAPTTTAPAVELGRVPLRQSRPPGTD